jgi:hypothetical protein
MLGGLQVEERSGAVDGIIIRCGGGLISVLRDFKFKLGTS